MIINEIIALVLGEMSMLVLLRKPKMSAKVAIAGIATKNRISGKVENCSGMLKAWA